MVLKVLLNIKQTSKSYQICHVNQREQEIKKTQINKILHEPDVSNLFLIPLIETTYFRVDCSFDTKVIIVY